MIYDHVMIDFETLGTGPDCAVLSMGAVKFNRENVCTDHFHHMFDVQAQLDAERTVTADTISWWMAQSSKARAQFNTSRIQLGPGLVLDSFRRWWGESKFVWSHGSNFDTVIYEDLSHMWSRPVPWKFQAVRDTRTLFHIFNETHPSFEGVLREHLKPGGVTAHDALIDSINQANAVRYAWYMMSP